jgi:hypothetical protein
VSVHHTLTSIDNLTGGKSWVFNEIADMTILIAIVFWHVDPLLGNDERNKKIYNSRCSVTAPQTSMFQPQQFNCNRGTVFLRCPCRDVISRVKGPYVRTCSLFKSGRLRTTIKLTLYKALIGSVMTYACLTWEHAAGAHLLKLQRLQDRVLCATWNLDRCTPVRELHVVSKFLTCMTP